MASVFCWSRRVGRESPPSLWPSCLHGRTATSTFASTEYLAKYPRAFSLPLVAYFAHLFAKQKGKSELDKHGGGSFLLSFTGSIARSFEGQVHSLEALCDQDCRISAGTLELGCQTNAKSSAGVESSCLVDLNFCARLAVLVAPI